MKKNWTKEEEQYLIDNYKKIDFNEIVEHLNRSKSSVEKKISRLGLTDKVKRWSNDEITYLKDGYGHKNMNEMMAYLSRSYESICIKANKLGLKRVERDTDNMGLYTVDKDYFKHIDSSNKAYFLGWAMTDGNILYDEKKHQHQFRLRINKEDVDVLEKLLDDIKSTTKIYYRDDYVEINICDREFVKNLLQYGFSNNKTYTICFPDINQKYYFDFIKGCFDGDGSYIFTDKTKKINFISASYSLISEIKNIFDEHSIKSYLYKVDTYYRLEINSKKSIKNYLNIVLNTESNFMNRKLDKMNSLLKYVS